MQRVVCSRAQTTKKLVRVREFREVQLSSLVANLEEGQLP